MGKGLKVLSAVFTATIIILFTGCGGKEVKLEKVATPIISPETGSYKQTQSVTITCKTADAIVRYTIDGTIPSESSAVYKEAIEVKEVTTVKAKAFKEGMIPSNTAESMITISNITLDSIKIKTVPLKTEYYIGESDLDISGLVVEGTYSDGSTKSETVTESNITGFETKTSGVKNLTLSLNGKSAQFNITVIDATLKTISIITPPTKQTYYIGETTLNITGLTVKGTYSDGSTKSETVTESNITGFETKTSGVKNLTLSLNGKSAQFNITVIDATLKTISIITPPTKQTYYIGETTLNITGLTVKGTYSDGSTKSETVTESNITGFETKTSGVKNLTLSLNGKSVQFNITVIDATLKTISIITPPTKQTYYIGETTLNITGLTVKGTYSDGSTKSETVTESNITGFETKTSGVKNLTLSLNGKSVQFNITVIDEISAVFTLIRKIDILQINEYSGVFELYDSSVTKLEFGGTNSISPVTVVIADKKGSLSSIKIGADVTEITIKALNASGNQIGNSKKITVNKF